MAALLPGQLPWWVAGPGIGVCVVALYALCNVKLGVSGSWLQLMNGLTGRGVSEAWRLWFLGGMVGGASLAGLVGPSRVSGSGRLAEALPPTALVPVLLLSGLLIGYGARWAGGCTSGHGIAGCSAGSPESLAATATFFSVAIVTTLVVHLLSGGAV